MTFGELRGTSVNLKLSECLGFCRSKACAEQTEGDLARKASILGDRPGDEHW